MAEEQRTEGPQEGSGQTETAADIRPGGLHQHHRTVSEESGAEPEQEEACEVTTTGRRSAIAGLTRQEIVALHHSLGWDRGGTEGSLTISSVSLPILNSVYFSLIPL